MGQADLEPMEFVAESAGQRHVEHAKRAARSQDGVREYEWLPWLVTFASLEQEVTAGGQRVTTDDRGHDEPEIKHNEACE
jgi:hypothetical protein